MRSSSLRKNGKCYREKQRGTTRPTGKIGTPGSTVADVVGRPRENLAGDMRTGHTKGKTMSVATTVRNASCSQKHLHTCYAHSSTEGVGALGNHRHVWARGHGFLAKANHLT